MSPETSTPSLARRSEDIALDLLKFLVSATNVVKSHSSTPGFGAANAKDSEDQVSKLLDLYARCRHAVEEKQS